MTAQFGKIQKLDEPKRNGEWMVFPAHCERGMLDMSLALDDKDKISGFIFPGRTLGPPSPQLGNKGQIYRGRAKAATARNAAGRLWCVGLPAPKRLADYFAFSTSFWNCSIMP